MIRPDLTRQRRDLQPGVVSHPSGHGAYGRNIMFIRPPFEDDPRTVAVSLGMVDAGIEKFYMGHGGPLDAREVESHVRSLLAMP